jgi:hypothetical protein
LLTLGGSEMGTEVTLGFGSYQVTEETVPNSPIGQHTSTQFSKDCLVLYIQMRQRHVQLIIYSILDFSGKGRKSITSSIYLILNYLLR